MKKLLLLTVCLTLILSVGCQSGDSGSLDRKELTLNSQKEKFSYSVGFNMGRNLRPIAGELDFGILMQAIKDSISGALPQLPEGEIQTILVNYQKARNQKIQEQREKIGEKNKVEGETFLKENGKKEGIKTTQSGLQYQVITPGTGNSPAVSDKVKVHYKGMLTNGVEFDSSYKKGEPQIFKLNEMIPGFTEGVQLMKVGSKYKFFLPSNLGYAERGAGRLVTPHSVLVFEIELLEIVKPD